MGPHSLEEACASAKIDSEEVLFELEPQLRASPGKAWSDAPQGELFAHIIETYHEPLPELLDHIEALMTRVYKCQSPKNPERPGASMKHSSPWPETCHIKEEETVLFLWILSAEKTPPSSMIRVMLSEPDEARVHLETITKLTDNFQAPTEACRRWKNLNKQLKHLDL